MNRRNRKQPARLSKAAAQVMKVSKGEVLELVGGVGRGGEEVCGSFFHPALFAAVCPTCFGQVNSWQSMVGCHAAPCLWQCATQEL